VRAPLCDGACERRSAQVLHGAKLWFMSPPADKPQFDGDVTQMQVWHPATRSPCSRHALLLFPPCAAPLPAARRGR
jgi:hypothetical protein